MRLFRPCLLTAFLLLAAPAFAQPYFDGGAIPPALIQPPPAPHSPAWDVEIIHIIEMQAHADPKEIAAAARERNLSPEAVALPVAPWLTRADFPAVYALLDRAGETAGSATGTAKRYWNTRRPYLMDSRIKALIEPHDNPAYPSGHTADSYAVAHVLGMLLPGSRDAFYARAEAIAQHRVLVGMHFPHDIASGRKLALLIVGGLLQNEEFQDDFEKAKAEIAAGNH